MKEHDCPLSGEEIKTIKNFTTTNEKFLHMQEDIQSLKDNVNELTGNVKEIRDALLGDNFNPGFKQRILKVEQDTEVNTKKISTLYIYVGAIVSILGFVSLAIGVLTKFGII